MANPYQTALTKQLNGPGFMAPGDMTVDPPPASSLQDILSKHQYGAAGLAAAEPELTRAGYQLQKDSGGRVRGRLKGPTGDIIDVIGQGEGNDWWNNPTGSAWHINNRGQAGLDAGGWSFGGPSLSGSMALPPELLMPQPKDVGPFSPTGDNMADPNQRSPFLEALLKQLGGAA